MEITLVIVCSVAFYVGFLLFSAKHDLVQCINDDKNLIFLFLLIKYN